MEIVAKEFDGVEFKLESLVQLVVVSKALRIKLLFAATFSGASLRKKKYIFSLITEVWRTPPLAPSSIVHLCVKSYSYLTRCLAIFPKFINTEIHYDS